MKTHLHWISVDEDMPYTGESVLTYGKSGLGWTIDVNYVYCSSDHKPTFQKGWRKGEHYEVTHWARIITPPNIDENYKCEKCKQELTPQKVKV